MSRVRSAKVIMREISPENQQQELRKSQRVICEQLETITSQLQLQSEAMFGDQGWAQAGLPGFGDGLIEFGKSLSKYGAILYSLGEKLKSGELPRWITDQQAAYGASPMARLTFSHHFEIARLDDKTQVETRSTSTPEVLQ
jgi:hypothetical protein